VEEGRVRALALSKGGRRPRGCPIAAEAITTSAERRRAACARRFVPLGRAEAPVVAAAAAAVPFPGKSGRPTIATSRHGEGTLPEARRGARARARARA